MYGITFTDVVLDAPPRMARSRSSTELTPYLLVTTSLPLRACFILVASTAVTENVHATSVTENVHAASTKELTRISRTVAQATARVAVETQSLKLRLGASARSTARLHQTITGANETGSTKQVGARARFGVCCCCAHHVRSS